MGGEGVLEQTFTFEVRVALAGYQVTAPGAMALPEPFAANAAATRWIVEAPPMPGRPAGSRCARPDVFEPLLYRSFAAIPTDDAGAILKFAGEWGFLSWERPLMERTPVGVIQRSPIEQSYSESLDLWRTEITKLAYAIRVYTAIREGDRAWLLSRVRFTPEAKVPVGNYVSPAEWHFRTHSPECGDAGYFARCSIAEGTPRVEYDQYTPWAQVEMHSPREHDEPRAVASAWLDQRVTDELKTDSQKGWAFSTAGHNGSRGIHVFPLDLLSLMWWQFARSVAREAEERACRECGRWFMLVPKDRGRKWFCSEAHKAKHFRARKKQAIELYASGEHTVETIAEATGSDADTVRSWLGITKEKQAAAKTKRK